MFRSNPTSRLPNWVAQRWRRGLAPSLTAVLLFVSGTTRGAVMPPTVQESGSEPVRYVGREQPDKRFYDGALRHAVGVHYYQALRANRTCPPEGGAMGWTYNHQPYLAFWSGRFYLQYLSTPKSEHVPPGRTSPLDSVVFQCPLAGEFSYHRRFS